MLKYISRNMFNWCEVFNQAQNSMNKSVLCVYVCNQSDQVLMFEKGGEESSQQD